MKHLFTSAFVLLLSAGLSAQTVDTVLFENFQTNVSDFWGYFPNGNDTTWLSIDEDGLTPNGGDETEQRWFQSQFFVEAEDTITGETNICAASLSYMEDFLPGNRNWLITPPIQVTDASYTLHWKSAPFQLPRYMDGYLVMAAENSNNLYEGAFTDTLFQVASMETILGDGESIALDSFTYTPGYIHGDDLSNWQYLRLWAEGDSTLLRGYLEPHSVSLAQYAGKTIYLAFLHNADDDYYLAVDDILVTRGAASSAVSPTEAALRFVTYPNPVATSMNVMYRLQENARVSLLLADQNGRLVETFFATQTQNAGEQNITLPLHRLPAGAYQLILQVNEKNFTRTFIKR
ncbi:MAG: T9SS type A sorting domain-containing protein [Chitinophagales bacterium]|nr:T9SS type A sorting domain-containing protein [Chitinophagales bacterium]